MDNMCRYLLQRSTMTMVIIEELSIYYFYKSETGGCLRGVMVKAMDCVIVVSEFVLQSRYYVHFRANTLGKGMNPLILPAMGYIVPLLFF